MEKMEMNASNDNLPQEGDVVDVKAGWLAQAVAHDLGEPPYVIVRVIRRLVHDHGQVFACIVPRKQYTKGMYVPAEESGVISGVPYHTIPVESVRVVRPRVAEDGTP